MRFVVCNQKYDNPFRDEGDHFMSKQLRVLALLAAAALAGCASVDAGDIQKFGVATAAVAEAAREAGEINENLTNTIRIEDQAGRFARGGLRYDFPPPYREKSRIASGWETRVAYAEALVAYGNALSMAAAGVGGPDIGAAVDNLKNTATEAAPNVLARPAFAQVANASVIIAKQGITMAAWQRIQTAMRRAHPVLVQGNALLAADFASVGIAVGDRYDDWLMMKRRVLTAIRQNGSAKERYDAYRLFVSEQQTLARSLAILVPAQGGGKPGYMAVLDKMAAAHKKLAEGEQNPATLAEFLAAAQQFQGLAEILAVNGDKS
jgi:hypothetical protein